MNEIQFQFKNLKPITQNHATGQMKGGRRFKTDTARNFETRIMCETLRCLPDIFKFEGAYSPYEHYLEARVTFFMPIDKLITKKGYISSKSLDLDNCLKYAIDGTFKRFEKIDDAAICEISAEKIPSEDNNYHIQIKLIKKELDELRNKTSSFINP